MATRCPRCGLRLDADGRCPAEAPLLPYAGRQWGTAQQLVHRLGVDITTAMVRRWRDRDGLTTQRGYSPLDEAARIEADKRTGGRGRRRRVDVGVALAA
ncbi:hypothetical protein GA0074692_0020 [Micromonospora pallida]|uniref:Uncharacterized protein n=1 Tax=Micromonospora pallida TaxID=145854 RepID=A0A1C6RH80_9ACTN|nr:hypothetical protein [Micromonospora pallida]SCL16399.1 hypothetical protein GA0074692_0020 [Micromonospora pallida]